MILLPGALLAGVMGMNFAAGSLRQRRNALVIIGVIVGLAPLTVGIAKRRRWV